MSKVVSNVIHIDGHFCNAILSLRYFLQKHRNMPVLFAKASEHVGTSNYRDESIGAPSTFLKLLQHRTLGMRYYFMPNIMAL